MWELDCKESWAPKNWCFWTVVLEKTLESPLDCKEIQPVHSEDQPWDFFGKNDAKAETLILWPPHAKSWLIGKDSDAGRDLGAEGERDDRGWDGWMGSQTRWTWVWVKSGRWWWTGKPGVLKSRTQLSDWTELNWDLFSRWMAWCEVVHSWGQLIWILSALLSRPHGSWSFSVPPGCLPLPFSVSPLTFSHTVFCMQSYSTSARGKALQIWVWLFESLFSPLV